MSAVEYLMQATYDANLRGPLVGYDSITHGFGGCYNGHGNTWLCEVLATKSDASYLFVGGTYISGGVSFPRSVFNLRWATDPTYDPPGGDLATGEEPGVIVTPPAEPHTWEVKFRWRATGDLPDGRSFADTALGFQIDLLAGVTVYIKKTWAEAPPVFRTDTVTIRSSGGADSAQFASMQKTLASNALRDSPTDPATGPDYLPVQLAWVRVTGPNPIVTIPTSAPGYRRGHFS
jgi:hypothetical protein